MMRLKTWILVLLGFSTLQLKGADVLQFLGTSRGIPEAYVRTKVTPCVEGVNGIYTTGRDLFWVVTDTNGFYGLTNLGANAYDLDWTASTKDSHIRIYVPIGNATYWATNLTTNLTANALSSQFANVTGATVTNFTIDSGNGRGLTNVPLSGDVTGTSSASVAINASGDFNVAGNLNVAISADFANTLVNINNNGDLALPAAGIFHDGSAYFGSGGLEITTNGSVFGNLGGGSNLTASLNLQLLAATNAVAYVHPGNNFSVLTDNQSTPSFDVGSLSVDTFRQLRVQDGVFGNGGIYDTSTNGIICTNGPIMGTNFSNTGIKWIAGNGSPNSVVTAPVGSYYTRTDGGAATTLYVKESGAGNTGWVGK